MIKRQAGFTLVELMVTMVIFVMVIAAASQIFSGLLTQYKQQSKIAETNIEGAVGLDILRRDIEHVGHGLPWIWVHSTASQEAAASPFSNYNDTAADAVPRAVVSGDTAGAGGSDVLVIKAINVSNDQAAHKWTYVIPGNTVKEWDILAERPNNGDNVIVMSLSDTNRRGLILVGGNFATTYDAASNPDKLANASFAADDDTDTRIVYGVDSGPLRMPYNRADYYISTTAAVPQRCAAGTGVLEKAVVSHPNGNMVPMPVLDCVADMQVVYRLDTDNNGTIDSDNNDISGLTAQQIREQLREIRVSVLAHEGQRDTQFTFTNFTGAATCATCVRVGESAGLGRDYDISGITNFLNYRWKVYRVVVQPINLR